MAHCKMDKEPEKHCQVTLFVSDAPLACGGEGLGPGTQGGTPAGPPPPATPAPPRLVARRAQVISQPH